MNHRTLAKAMRRRQLRAGLVDKTSGNLLPDSEILDCYLVCGKCSLGLCAVASSWGGLNRVFFASKEVAHHGNMPLLNRPICFHPNETPARSKANTRQVPATRAQFVERIPASRTVSHSAINVSIVPDYAGQNGPNDKGKIEMNDWKVAKKVTFI